MSWTRTYYGREWRWANLSPEYEMRAAPDYGLGYFPVHRETGEVCECRMEWSGDGTKLSCPTCGLDGT